MSGAEPHLLARPRAPLATHGSGQRSGFAHDLASGAPVERGLTRRDRRRAYGRGQVWPPGLAGRRRLERLVGPQPVIPTFVLTHRPRPPIETEGGTTFHSLDASPAEALAAASTAAAGQDVRIGGGPTVARDFMAAGLVDHTISFRCRSSSAAESDSGTVSKVSRRVTTSKRFRRPAGSPTSHSRGRDSRACEHHCVTISHRRTRP